MSSTIIPARHGHPAFAWLFVGIVADPLEVLQAYPSTFEGTDPDLGGWGYRDPRIVHPEPLVLIYHKHIVEVSLGVATPEADKCFTPAGIRFGSLQDAIRAAYGDPPSTRKKEYRSGGRHDQWVYNALGVTFEFNTAYSSAKQWPPSAVTEIRVFAPGRFCDTLDLESQITVLGHSTEISCAWYTPPP